MGLIFPNLSRSFDASRDTIRFWGYDTTIECPFFVTRAALRGLMPEMALDEAALLETFDRHRDLICMTAARLYTRGRKGSYVLDLPDF